MGKHTLLNFDTDPGVEVAQRTYLHAGQRHQHSNPLGALVSDGAPSLRVI